MICTIARKVLQWTQTLKLVCLRTSQCPGFLHSSQLFLHVLNLLRTRKTEGCLIHRPIYCEALNLLWRNSVWWCVIMSVSVMRKDWCSHFKVKVKVRVSMIKTWLSSTSSELLVYLQPNLVWWHVIVSWSVFWENWIAVFKVKVTAKFQNVSEYLSGRHVLNRWTIHYQIGFVAAWAEESWKECFAVFKVRVTVKARI